MFEIKISYGWNPTIRLLAQMTDLSYNKPADAPAYESFKQGEAVTVKLYEMRSVDYGQVGYIYKSVA